MAIPSGRRETYLLVVTTLVSCLGSYALTWALTSFPAIQSTSMGNAGQAYGAAAATTSVVVLVYLARTFRHQSEEAHLHRQVMEAQVSELGLQRETTQDQHKTVQRSAEAAVRGQHVKLLEMAINDPLLMGCWPDYGPDVSPERSKQYMYCNLVVSHHYMCYQLGYSTDDEVEASLHHLFGNEILRSFWGTTRTPRGRTAPYGGPMRKFYDLADLAYARRLADDGLTA
ncbi:DUF6082 family protein [Streptomyces sp. NPDC048172]|uniref:DUF6082 family protein n=1 Tax=Streptomyces sp. NPDC048172 TaxID=3365505 RepID=UPI00370FB723